MSADNLWELVLTYCLGPGGGTEVSRLVVNTFTLSHLPSSCLHFCELYLSSICSQIKWPKALPGPHSIPSVSSSLSTHSTAASPCPVALLQVHTYPPCSIMLTLNLAESSHTAPLHTDKGFFSLSNAVEKKHSTCYTHKKQNKTHTPRAKASWRGNLFLQKNKLTCSASTLEAGSSLHSYPRGGGDCVFFLLPGVTS